MLKPKRVAPIVWAIILLTIGVPLILYGLILEIPVLLTAYESLTHNDFIFELIVRGTCYFVFPLILAIVGLILLIIGISKNKKIEKENQAIRAKGEITQGQCPYCGYVMHVRRVDFMPHSRYPEGFVYCASCKKPMSFKLFIIIKSESGEPEDYDY